MPQAVTYVVPKSKYAVFGVLCGAVAAAGIVTSAVSGTWQPAAFCSLPLLFAMAWLSQFRLEFGDSYVAYRGWDGSGRLELADLAEVAFVGTPWRDPEIPSSICVLRSRTGETIIVRLVMFPREARLRLVRLVREGHNQPLQRTGAAARPS